MKFKRWTLLALLFVVACSTSQLPQDEPEELGPDTTINGRIGPDSEQAVRERLLTPQATGTGLYPPHDGFSEYLFDDFGDPSDSYIVTDSNTDGDLDVFRFNDELGGVLTIPLSVYRSIGDLNELKNNGLISQEAELIIPSFDVDEKTIPELDCDDDGINDRLNSEVNIVSFNGVEIGRLSGEDQEWSNNFFDIPIELINFAPFPGQLASNIVSVEIDTENKDVVLSSGVVGCPAWGVEVDWVGLQFEIASPVAYVPGTADSTLGPFFGFFDNLRDEVEAIGLNDYKIGLNPVGIGCLQADGASIREAARRVKTQLIGQAELMGTDAFHIVSYSKGGPNVRRFLHELGRNPVYVQVGVMGGQPVLRNLEIASFTAMGGTFLGTPIADYANLTGIVPPLIFDEVCDQTTQAMPGFIEDLDPLPIPSLAGVANADINGNARIDNGEGQGIGLVPFPDRTANFIYQLVRNNAGFEAELLPQPPIAFGPTPGFKIVPIPLSEGEFQENDVIVPVDSASDLPGPGVSRLDLDENHVTVIKNTASDVVNAGLSDLLKWRLR